MSDTLVYFRSNYLNFGTGNEDYGQCHYCKSYLYLHSSDRACKYQTADIYGLIDPRDNAVRYVGRTTVGLAIRLSGHISDARQRSWEPVNPAKAKWIRELQAKNLRPLIRLLETVRIDDLAAEQGWITNLELDGAVLLNGNLLLSTRTVPVPQLKILLDAFDAGDASTVAEKLTFLRRFVP